jgi:hypothetical protein
MMAIKRPESKRLTGVRIFLDRDDSLKDLATYPILNTRKTLTEPARAGKKVNYGDGERRLHRTVLDVRMRQQIAPAVQD